MTPTVITMISLRTMFTSYKLSSSIKTMKCTFASQRALCWMAGAASVYASTKTSSMFSAASQVVNSTKCQRSAKRNKRTSDKPQIAMEIILVCLPGVKSTTSREMSGILLLTCPLEFETLVHVLWQPIQSTFSEANINREWRWSSVTRFSSTLSLLISG